ncbi:MULTISPECIES: glycoside hydrolase family 3 protein [Flavobacteriaceae]|uniref:glycoside hydrolase family 3 protein n=1 Tax=Flavobacteriaceae TaxID=49546 RepID=UPI001FEC6BD5|nr:MULTISPECIES: glycoside hydrolase family 3 protein [Allomuricauda]MDC6367563.1 glycoside hydrolase family 3 protein [Muricauda sp. AC10]
MHKDLYTYQLSKIELSLKEKVGQLFMPAVFINDTEEEVQQMEDLIQKHCIGSICFFHSRASAATNFEGKKKVVYNEKSYDRLKELISRYQKAAKAPLLIAIDAEWGLAMRIENTPQYPYAITLGALTDKESLIEEVGFHIGVDCTKAGIHWNLSPVVDINNNPLNPVIGYRSFGDDKNKVTKKAEAFIKGMNHTGVLNSIKHFPGHGDTATDSHLGLPIIDKSLDELKKTELHPFQELIKNGVDSVMVGHLSLPQIDSEQPSTTSFKIVTELLRQQLGFNGVIISDALNMHAVSRKYPQKGKLEEAAFKAGMDVLCFSENVEEGIESILSWASEHRIQESFERIWLLKEKTFMKKKIEGIVPSKSHSELNKLVAEQSLTELYGNPTKAQLMKTSKFINLMFGNPSESIFSSKIQEEFGAESLELAKDLTTLEKKLEETQNIALSIFPPSIKPKDLFGFDPKQLEYIKELIATKNVLIYVFGNPFALDVLGLNPSSNAVVVYQDFPVFQEAAFNHFKGVLKAKGKLPVQLKTFRI